MSDAAGGRFNCNGRMRAKYKLVNKDGEEMLVPTPEWEERLSALKTKRIMQAAGVNVDLEYGLDTYIGGDGGKNIPKLKKYCDEFDGKFETVHLYMWSKTNGTQKSTCAKDIIARLAAKGIQGYFVLMDELIRMLLKAERDQTAEDKIKVWETARFLVIDECFAKGQVTLFSSGYQKAYLNTFLKKRLETDMRATCFTANIPVCKIGEVWGEGLQSLVDRSVTTPMFFNDTVCPTLFRNGDIWGDAE